MSLDIDLKKAPAASSATCEYKWVASPVGRLRLVARGDALAGVLWEVERANRVQLEPWVENEGNLVLVDVARQLAAYFDRRLTTFDIKLDFKGTEFQKKIWNALLTIPYGETRSYADIAHQVGHGSSVRAVGAANGRNPISIVAPCHRVIGSNGALTGFAGGLQVKKALLTIEDRDSRAFDFELRGVTLL